MSQGGGISKGVGEIKPNQSTTLVTDINGLVQSLESIKAVHLRYVARTMADSGAEGPVALIDGGATHGLRTGRAEELDGAESVVVELAHGSTTLYRRVGCSTLLAKYRLLSVKTSCSLLQTVSGRRRGSTGG